MRTLNEKKLPKWTQRRSNAPKERVWKWWWGSCFQCLDIRDHFNADFFPVIFFAYGPCSGGLGRIQHYHKLVGVQTNYRQVYL